MKLVTKLAWFAAAALILAPAAHANTYEDRLAELRSKFKASDKNKDGKLTLQEAKEGGMSRIAANFSRVDADNDGYVKLAVQRTSDEIARLLEVGAARLQTMQQAA